MSMGGPAAGWHLMSSFRRDPSVTEKRLPPGTVKRIARFAAPYRRQLVAFLALVVVDAVIGAAIPWIYGDIVREIQRHSIERRRSPRTLQSLSSALGWPAGHLAAVLDGRMQVEPASRDNVLSRLDRVERQLDDITGRLDALRADLATVLVHVRAGR